MILDDLDSRPGSATSILRTIIGAALRGRGGWMSVAEFIRLMDAVGVTEAHARTAVLRVKKKGLLLAEVRDGQAGYRLNPDAVPLLERGDRRIYTLRQQADGGQWCVVSFSLPESERPARHQLRKRLVWVGCGKVATGLWICPALLADEVEEILTDLGVRHAATVFITESPRTATPLADAVARWWDLDAIANLHHEFIDAFTTWGPVDDPRDAFSRYVRVLDRWRDIPYLDPGLQPAVLPADWPGFQSVALFNRLRDDLAENADRFVNDSLTRTTS